MKVRDLSHFEMPGGKAWVCVNELTFLFDASVFASGSNFSIGLRPPGVDGVQYVAAVNCSRDQLDTICEWDGAFYEWELVYLVHSDCLENLSNVLTSDVNLAVIGMAVDGEWIRFKLAPAEAGDRSSADFNRGLLVGKTSHRGDSSPKQRMDATTKPLPTKVQIIRIFSSRLKPFKKILPNKLVHLAYRALEVIR